LFERAGRGFFVVTVVFLVVFSSSSLEEATDFFEEELEEATGFLVDELEATGFFELEGGGGFLVVVFSASSLDEELGGTMLFFQKACFVGAVFFSVTISWELEELEAGTSALLELLDEDFGITCFFNVGFLGTGLETVVT